MPRTAEQLQGDLHSGDPARIAAGLEALAHHLESLEPVTVAPLTAELLSPFGGELPDAVAGQFFKLLQRFDGFSPAPSQADREREASLAAARFGPSSFGLQVSLMLKLAEDPPLAVRRALAAVAARGVRPTEVEHAGKFLSYLLAGRAPVRAATVEALATWRGHPGLAKAVAWVEPELDADERARLLS